MTNNCDCDTCRISRLEEELELLRLKVARLEEARSLPVLGTIGEGGRVIWANAEETV